MKHKTKDKPMASTSTTDNQIVILHVEDDPDHAELVRRSFESHRVTNRLMLVSDGEVALDYLFRRGDYADPKKSPTPTIILLDLRLPKIDGLEVLTVIKSDPTLKYIPVVILTTSEAETDVARAYELHANSYLVKPVDFNKFARLMEELGFYWLKWNFCPEK